VPTAPTSSPGDSGKEGQDVEGIPVFDTVDARRRDGANTSLVFVPARFAVDAVYEAVDAGIGRSSASLSTSPFTTR
jgi:succinyl-CoA synthetase alpha subunit